VDIAVRRCPPHLRNPGEGMLGLLGAAGIGKLVGAAVPGGLERRSFWGRTAWSGRLCWCRRNGLVSRQRPGGGCRCWPAGMRAGGPDPGHKPGTKSESLSVCAPIESGQRPADLLADRHSIRIYVSNCTSSRIRTSHTAPDRFALLPLGRRNVIL